MRSDKLTLRRRVEAVLDLLCQGALFHQIRHYASKQEPPWNVSDRQLRRYIRAAHKRLARILDKDRERLLNLHIARREHLYGRSLLMNDCPTTSRVLKDQAELLGLYDDPRVEALGKKIAELETLLHDQPHKCDEPERPESAGGPPAGRGAGPDGAGDGSPPDGIPD